MDVQKQKKTCIRGIDPSRSNLRWSTHATCVLLYSPRRYQEFLIVGILLSPTNGLMTIPQYG